MASLSRHVRSVVFALATAICVVAMTIGGATAQPTGPGVNNVAIIGNHAYAAAGGTGFVVTRLSDAQRVAMVQPVSGTDTVDDIALDGELLFALDATAPGALSVFSLGDPAQPMLVAGPVPVDVGPFAGVSAAGGRVVVSGGTSRLNVLTYNDDGRLGSARATTDLGRGQPDILVAANGGSVTGYVSTDFSGEVDGARFGVTLIDIAAPPTAPPTLATVGIVGSGFTGGVRQPANFPIESALIGTTLYVASGAGVTVIDVTERNRPVVRSTLGVGADGANFISIDAVGTNLFVLAAAPTPMAFVVDIADLDAPQLLRTIDLAGGQPTGIAATAAHIAIADNVRGLLIFAR